MRLLHLQYISRQRICCACQSLHSAKVMVTFTGQNYGAGKYERIRKRILVCNGIAAAVLVVLSWSALAAGKWILSAFCPDQQVVAEGMRIISVTFPVYFVYSLFGFTGGVVRGIGKSVPSMVIVIVNLCVIRILMLEISDRVFHSVQAGGSGLSSDVADGNIVICRILSVCPGNRCCNEGMPVLLWV